MQKPRTSLFEAIVNVIVGYFITMLASPAIYWLTDVHMSFGQMNGTVFCFTVVSIVRQYIIRRFFNNKIDK